MKSFLETRDFCLENYNAYLIILEPRNLKEILIPKARNFEGFSKLYIDYVF